MTDTPNDESDVAMMEDPVSYFLDCEYAPPTGGFPQANPDGTRMPPTERAQSVPTAAAAREMSAYGEHDYRESVLSGQKRQRSRTPARRGKTQKLGGAYGNARKEIPSDSDKLGAFDASA